MAKYLHELTKRHCNFQIIGLKSTGTYRFTTGYYGLTIMPTELQKVMDLTLANINSLFVCIDDILIVTKGTKHDRINKVREVMKILDEANLQLKAEKCVIARTSIEWLGYKLSRTGISPINTKAQGKSCRLRPTNLKQLRSFLGAVNQFINFIPNLATFSYPFRSILKKDAEWKWQKEHEEAFSKINQEISKTAELSHFKRDEEIRIICDAGKQGLGAVLQQIQDNGEWRPICFASRFLIDFEAKSSINELELLAIVWAIENFKNYVYGVQFKVVSDHKALSSVLKPNRGNKTFSSRLTSRVDRLLPFQFEVVHAAGRTLGMADYLSRHPSEMQGAAVKAETLWNEWFTVNSVSSLNDVLEANATTSENRANDESERNSSYRIIDAKSSQPIRKQEERDLREQSKIHCSQSVKRVKVTKMNQNSAIMLLNEKMFQQSTQRIKLSKEQSQSLKNTLKQPLADSPLRGGKSFNLFPFDNREFLHMDNRLVIPQSIRQMIMCSSMLFLVADIWWPRIHQEVINQYSWRSESFEINFVLTI